MTKGIDIEEPPLIPVGKHLEDERTENMRKTPNFENNVDFYHGLACAVAMQLQRTRIE